MYSVTGRDYHLGQPLLLEDGSVPRTNDLLIRIYIFEIRKMLINYQEGIKLSDFFHLYCINCPRNLCLSELGFDTIEGFLLSIARDVPLRIDSVEGSQIVHFTGLRDEIVPPNVKELVPISQEKIGGCLDWDYKPAKLPYGFDVTKCVHMYISHIFHPGLLFIQLAGETSDPYTEMYNDIEVFYRRPYNSLYEMKIADIKAGAMCVALWQDELWYRAKILSVESVYSVRVSFVDYGTIGVVKYTRLRHILEKYSELPIQCIRSRLAYLKPTNSETGWHQDSCKIVRKLCYNICLTAKIVDTKTSTLSLIVCDLNGKKNVNFNDELYKEGLAYYDVEEIKQQTALQVISPQQFQEAWCMGTLAAVYATMLNLGGNFQNNPSLATSPSTGTYSQPGMFPIQSQVPKLPSEIEYFTNPELKSNNHTSPNRSLNEGSGMFQDVVSKEFIQKLSLISKRYVKRIRTEDGYVFNILIVESEPYISSGDISVLIWCSEEPNYLLGRLQNRNSFLPSLKVTEDSNEEMFKQFERFHVKGSQKVGGKSHIQVFPLNKAIEILNMFGHPSVELRTVIRKEISSFNPHHPMWQELPEIEVSEDKEEEESKTATKDDKLNKLCLNDLQSMKKVILNRRFRLINNLENDPNNSCCVDELDKLRSLLRKVVERIEQVKHICSSIS